MTQPLVVGVRWPVTRRPVPGNGLHVRSNPHPPDTGETPGRTNQRWATLWRVRELLDAQIKQWLVGGIATPLYMDNLWIIYG